MKVSMVVQFDVLHLYYLPQYLPVLKALKEAGVTATFVFYKNADVNLQKVMEDIICEESLDAVWVTDWTAALAHYQQAKPEWIIFGNAVNDLDKLHQHSKTVLMQHGIGPKACYYEVSQNPTTVRFVEGQHRLNRLNKLYPNGNFVDTGYAKLDAIFDDAKSDFSLSTLGLNETKPTLLYAPTFYPSSLEMMPKNLPQLLSEYNIIIKPHFFSLTKQKYRKQRDRLIHWQQFDNVYVANEQDYNLMPFMKVADVMLSDASSAIFEFAALNKPVIWCDFYKLRWSYRGIFSFRFKNRLDGDIEYFNKVAYQVKHAEKIPEVVRQALSEPSRNAKLKAQTILELAGVIDGQCSTRITNYLLEN